MLQSSSSIQYSFSVLFIYSKSLCLHLIIEGFKYFLNQNGRNTYYFLIARKYFLPKEKPHHRSYVLLRLICGWILKILHGTKVLRTICNNVWFFVNPQSQLVVDVFTGSFGGLKTILQDAQVIFDFGWTYSFNKHTQWLLDIHKNHHGFHARFKNLSVSP